MSNETGTNQFMGKNFVIVGTQRTGSSVIAAAIGTHPEICCGWEWTQKVLPPLKIKAMSQGLRGNFSLLDKGNKTHMQSIYSEETRWLGFRRLFRSSDKWLLQPKYSPALWLDCFEAHLRWFARNPSLHIIHIVRQDNMAWLRSKFIARQTKLYIGKKYPENIQVRINIKEAVKRLYAKKWLDGQLATLARSNPYIQVIFEDFAINNRPVIERIISFLHCNPEYLPKSIIKTQKQATTPVEQSIINFEELVSALQKLNLIQQPSLVPENRF